MQPKKARDSDGAASKAEARRKRLAPDDRRKLILEGAISYFAEEGFEGGTRALAKRLGVTQPLIYNYYPTKDDLVREVYESVFVGRWRSEWTDLLTNRDKPLFDRLVEFYMFYTEVIYSPDWIRIFLHSGLKGIEINARWTSFIEDHLLRVICNEVRHAHGFPTMSEEAITDREIDGCWLFHGGIFYQGVRRELYKAPARLPRRELIETSVTGLIVALPVIIRDALGDAQCARPETEDAGAS